MMENTSDLKSGLMLFAVFLALFLIVLIMLALLTYIGAVVVIPLLFSSAVGEETLEEAIFGLKLILSFCILIMALSTIQWIKGRISRKEFLMTGLNILFFLFSLGGYSLSMIIALDLTATFFDWPWPVPPWRSAPYW